ncbi:amidohydrolase family protein [Micrococcus sp.]|uniref:amidohydrolase family protein n=1 Tax=Micrococcus sp. TaxID=1271 RepID=UPI002A9099B5|nr:amidohydrolase family protein [Micrococcus sp.]MDY6054408.1 amidohydrolase family protein [Micrococcus sp.]
MSEPPLAPGAIDTHAHVYPDAYLDLLERGGRDPETTRIARGMGAGSGEAEIAARLALMDRAGVGVQVLAATPQSPSLADPEDAARAARWINDEYLRLQAAHPDRFLIYLALPLPHVAESLAELTRLLDGPEPAAGVVGVSLPTVLPDGTVPADPRLDPVWEDLDRRGLVVNLHPTGSGAGSPLIADHGLAWVNGAPVEDATAVLQLMAADHLRRFPRARLHVAHLGGDLPFLAQRLEDNHEDWGQFPASPRTMLRQIHYDAANFHEPSLAMTAETVGAEQILAGSDFPYFQDAKYVRAFEYVRTSRLSPTERDGVLGANARRLYGL